MEIESIVFDLKGVRASRRVPYVYSTEEGDRKKTTTQKADEPFCFHMVWEKTRPSTYPQRHQFD